MLGFIFIGLIFAAILFETLSLRDPLRKVSVSYNLDMLMAEPGEQITVSYQITNTGKLPVLYLGLSFSFDKGVTICENQKWLDKHLTRSFTGISVDNSFFIMPHRCVRGRFHISLEKRGIYRLGRCYLEAGDILGLKSSVTTIEGKKKIVCTAALAENDPEIEVLGGFLGDISVRRFIMEDPSLLVGYKEYTGVEPMKKISWIQSAKTGKLMVKQNDFTLDTDVAIAVNLERNNASPMDLERCLELTRTACEKLEEMKIPYAFISNGDLRDLQQGFGRGHLSEILRNIGQSAPTCYKSFDSLIDKCIAGNRNNRSYILITRILMIRTRRHWQGFRAFQTMRSVCYMVEKTGSRRSLYESRIRTKGRILYLFHLCLFMCNALV